MPIQNYLSATVNPLAPFAGTTAFRALATFLLLAVAAVSGCSRSGHARISGEVTLDGEPVERGTVRFVATDGQAPSAEAVIQNGRYRAEVVPGEKRVEIQGFRVIGEARRNDDPSAPLEEITEPIVPARFNTNSELVREIGPRSATHDFHLTTR